MKINSQRQTLSPRSAAKSLIAGNLVAFPTETVYGLGADAHNEAAVRRIYEVKDRPFGNPLILHINSLDNIYYWARQIPEYAIQLAKCFWPGPMTLVFLRKNVAKNFITSGQETVALRIPSHPMAQKLLLEFEKLGGKAVVAPSANKFGKLSPTSAEAVIEELNERLSDGDLILNGGKCKIGIESTIIDCTKPEPKVLRPGAVTPEQIKRVLSLKTSVNLYTSSFDLNLETNVKNIASNEIRVPGSYHKHYSPNAQVLINQPPMAGHGLIALKHITTPEGVLRLSNPRNASEFAASLYESLRLGDRLNLTHICVFPPIKGSLVDAINDRLTKAANK